MHISCFPFNTKTTTLISIVSSSSLQPLHHAFPPPPPLSSQHYYHHHHIITSIFFSTFLLLSFSSSFSLSNRKWLWQTEHNLKELRKTIISRCFIVYLYLVSFSCMIPVLQPQIGYLSFLFPRAPLDAKRRLAAWYKVSDIRLRENPLGDCTAPCFMYV